MDLANKSVLVLGLGLTGQSAARFCGERGAHVALADERPAEQIEHLAELRSAVGVREVHVGVPFPDPSDYDITVPSPGVPQARYREAARSAWGDIELAGRHLEVPVVAVTGTNGKSTTVRLIEALFRTSGRRAQAAGNVGTPALSLVGAPLDVAVLEVSSFQLEATQDFRPQVSVVLNITPDHLDRHGDLPGYIAAKQRLLANQKPEDVAVLSFDDESVRTMAKQTHAEVVGFSVRGKPDTGPGRRAAWIDTGAAVLRDGDHLARIDLTGCALSGAHNQENVLAALTAVWVAGVDPHAAAPALADFSPLPHRSELISDALGLQWIDDSKATNPGAAIRALESQPGRVIWIAGGRGKGLSFETLADRAAVTTIRALLIGESAEEIENALRDRVPCERASDLEAAVQRAAEIGHPGETVLLAPGCSSLDQFSDFEERGRCFQQAIRHLEARRPQP